MDAGTVLNGVILVVGALFGILKQLLIYVMSFLYLLVSPLLYLGRGLLSLALLPVRIILKFEVRPHLVKDLIYASGTHYFEGFHLLRHWSCAYGHYGRPVSAFCRYLVIAASPT